LNLIENVLKYVSIMPMADLKPRINTFQNFLKKL